MTNDKTEILDDMLVGLVELLEEKGVITNEEWEQKVEEKLVENENLDVAGMKSDEE